MARDEYLKHLASIPLFSECTKKELQEIGKLATEIEIPAGREFIKEGDYAQEMSVIVEGHRRRSREAARRSPPSARRCRRGAGPLQHRPRNATVTSDTEVDMLVIDSGRHGNAPAR